MVNTGSTPATIRDLWAQGVIHPVSKNILAYPQSHEAFSRLEVKQLDTNITESGQNVAGAVLTQIAKYSPILNQSTVLSNDGFTCAFTYRINGSIALLHRASGVMNNLASCPVLKKEGTPCGCHLEDDHTHFIGCKSHGFHLRPHYRMEDTPYATFQDALRDRINETNAFTCLNHVKRPRTIGNLCTSIPCTVGKCDKESDTFEQGNQADGMNN